MDGGGENSGGTGGASVPGSAGPEGHADATNTLKFRVRLAHVSGPSRKRVVEERGGDRAEADAPDAQQAPAGRMPRVTRLLVQAHHFQRMLDRGEAADLADIARRFRLSRARVTQVMDLTLLAPDIQEEILFLAPIPRGGEPMSAIDLRAVLRAGGWAEQRQAFRSRRPEVGP